MRFAVCNEMFQNMPLEQHFAVAADMGFDALEIAPFTIRPYVTEITTQERERLRTLARENGVEIAAIHWVLAKTEGFHVTHPDPAVRRKTIGYLRALVQFGIEIGAQAMVVGSPAQRRLLEDVTYSEAWKWFAEAMAAAASEGAGTGFKICIEPLAPDTDNNFLFKTSEVVKMVQEIGMPNCGVIIDTYSASRTEEDIPAAIRLAGPHLMHYHCNDLNKRAPGWGRVDFVPIFDALLDIRFAGYCSIEVFDFSIEPREHAGKGLQFLRDALAEAMSRRRR